MANDLTKRAGSTAPKQAEDAASRLKRALMEDSLARVLGEDGEKTVPGNPRVIFGLANHGRSPGWACAKILQRRMFDAAAGSNLQMKFAFYGADNAAGVRRCRITTRWITDPDDMASIMDKAECNCGCYVYLHSVLAQAVKEAEERPLRALILAGDAFHDDQDGLDEAAIAANRLRREGTTLFLLQLGDDPHTTRKLQYLARVSGAAHFRFDPRTQQQQFAEMLELVAAFAAGGKQAVKSAGGQAATMLLQHLTQEPLHIEERARARVELDPHNSGGS